MADPIDIFRSVNLLISEHGANATVQAGMRADDMLARGNLDGVRKMGRPRNAVSIAF